ncbi:histidine phosphatase superfamily [Stachybotrys elegans]|uniref:3-phytase n=1 Tax=Stachybotrys elegans TaxID=80388 RepID=A0A8K0SZM8_9HYPO|nr:histidine phosphatase superfamily [Stachybotrys elegans]
MASTHAAASAAPSAGASSRSLPKPSHARKDSSGGYQLVGQDEEGVDVDHTASPRLRHYRPEANYRTYTFALIGCVVILLASNLYLGIPYFFPSSGAPGSDRCPDRAHDVPQYFQTAPELWAGPTATGEPAFLAQTRVLNPSESFVPNEPLQTAIPIQGMQHGDQSIFKMMGYLSPYTPSPGFGVDEYPLPDGAKIVQVQMLSRHGARYPTSGSNVADLGRKIAQASSKFKPSGALSFLASWRYQLGAEILVPKGREELFNSGVLHSYMYGHLYNPNSKLIVRTTTQDRMLKSAENWVAGFFGLEWTNNATIEVIIEDGNFNNSLAGSLACTNSWPMATGNEARDVWTAVYLKDAVARFQNMTEGFEWTVADVYAAQSMCPYETVAYGYSKFCDLFTYEEWQGFEYSVDVWFAGVSGFKSPTGRAVGLGYQQEVLARLKNHTLGYSGSNINVTLDSSTETFPLNQSLYFDFSHDTNIASILVAFGLKQFAEELPATEHPGKHAFTVSHLTPFGARLDMEIIKSPKPVAPNREGFLEGGETKYIHFVLNQRTLPLGESFPECDASRKDGWCELETFIKIQEGMTEAAQYDYACYGDYTKPPYDKVTDGVPV